jgi:hypothetical protein
MTSSRLVVPDFESSLGVGFKYNISHTFLSTLCGRKMCLFCLQLGFSSRKRIIVTPYSTAMLSYCHMLIAACNLGFALLQALDPVAYTVLFKTSVALRSKLVLFTTPWRLMNEWRWGYTRSWPSHKMEVNGQPTSRFTPLYSHREPPPPPVPVG